MSRALPRPDTDEGVRTPVRRRALVLGLRETAELIAGELGALGVSASLPPEGEPSVPGPAHPDGAAGLRRALERFRASAGGAAVAYVHPGASPWAERTELSALCDELGLLLIGPPARALSLFGNRLGLLLEGEKIGIPHLLLSLDPMHSGREIERLVLRAGHRFPFVLKSVRGGAALPVLEPEDLRRRVPLWLEQLRRSSGDSIVLAERCLEAARRVLLPFARFADGTFEAFPPVDSSLQSRHRKFLELCPADGIGEQVLDLMREGAGGLAGAAGYVGLGCLEFLVEDPVAYLIDGLPRLNTGFRLWERVAGVSAVEWQLAALESRSPSRQLSRAPRDEWASGLAIRIHAEDSLLQLPQPGHIRECGSKQSWRFPEEPATPARAVADLALRHREGESVSPEEDGLVALLFVGGRDRKQALALAEGALAELWFAGSLQTNERFVAELLTHPWVREGVFHAGFVDEDFLPAPRPPADLLRLFAGVMLHHPTVAADARLEIAGASERWAVGEQWIRPEPALARWEKGPDLWVKDDLPGISGWLRVDGAAQRVCAFPLMADRWLIRIGSWQSRVRRLIRHAGEARRRPPRLTALVQGQVHSLLCREGGIVEAREPLLVLESLGSLVPHSLPVRARLLRWRVQSEERVEAGSDLADLELLPAEADPPQRPPERQDS